MQRKKIVVVGGGITGLTAAYYFTQYAEKQALSYDISILEASDRLGGKINTVRDKGFVIERGPDSFLERKTPAVELAEELGLTGELVRNSTGQAHILVGDTLYPIPAGSYMGIPLQEDALAKTVIASEAGKERVQEELDIPQSDPATDQSLGHFLRGRFGDEWIENVIEPLLSGIYASDIDEMSLMATFPQFYELEQEYGSLIEGLKATLPTAQASTGKRKGQFLSFRKGLVTFVEALEQAIGEERIFRETQVEKIVKQGTAYKLSLGNDDVMHADAVIMTIPSHQLATAIPSFSLFDEWRNAPFTSVANVVFAFDENAVQEALDGTGFVVSRNSDFRITACTWTNRKWPSTTPKGKVLLRAYVGKPTDQSVLELSDEAIADTVLTDLKKVMQISGEPEFSIVTRWEQAMPQYTIGHAETVEKIRTEMTEQLPGIYIAGSSFDGVGIPDCIAQGKEAAAQVLEFLKSE